MIGRDESRMRYSRRRRKSKGLSKGKYSVWRGREEKPCGRESRIP